MIQKFGIDYYISKLQKNEYFALASYGDAEWMCVTKTNLGTPTGLGQIIDEETGNKLSTILCQRDGDPNFKIAVPECMWYRPKDFYVKLTKRIDDFCSKHHILGPWYERDEVNDELAERAGLYPFIKQFQQMSVVIVGNRALKDLDFLNPQRVIGIPSPNCHIEEGAINQAVTECLTYGKSGVYLISAGVSAPLIIDQLYDAVPDSFFIDCGSIWDAFVGIGGQRKWRRELYSDPDKLKRWRHDNLCGKD